MVKISVIIPVFNAAQFLPKCLSSVCSQALREIEIICVNDASTDESLAILQKFSREDSRIKIINLKENKGAAFARNLAIENAVGEYLGFVDSDDFIDQNFYEKLYNKAYESKADAVKGNIRIYCPNTKSITQESWIDINSKVKQHKANFCFSFTTAIYKTTLIKENSVKFLEGLIHFEDPYFTIKAALFYKKLEVLDDVFYYYVNNPASSSRKEFTVNHIDSLNAGVCKVLDVLDEYCFDKNHYIIVFNFLLEQLLFCSNRAGFNEEIRMKANSKLAILRNRCRYKEECASYHILQKKIAQKEEIITSLRSKVKCDLKIPKVSVIIPVYNAEKYLERCLNSVCGQSLKDIEIICVNDFSTDSSLQILEEYSKKYPNLKIVNLHKNQGESCARNAGLALARGEYLAFVDNDDEIDLNFYEKLYENTKENDADIVKGQAVEIAYDGQKHYVKQIEEGGDKMLFATYWWTAIYKRSLISKNNIFFSTAHSLGGDLLFLNKAVIAAKDLSLVNNTYYHYHRREDSGDSKILPKEKIKSALSIFEEIVNNINSNVANGFVYNFIVSHFIIGCFYLSLKSEDEKGKIICAKTALNIFEKCRDKDGLKLNFSTTAPNLFQLLKNKDSGGVENLFIKCKSRMELVASGLRARIKNNMNPLISIIMPVKNGSNYLAQALTAIKAQNVKMEIILVNDGSNDNTVQIAQDFGCVILHHEKSKGLVASKNTALKVARGKYIMFHDHDDLLNQNALARMLKEFEESPEIYAVMAQLQDFFSPELSENDKARVALRAEAYYGLFSGATLIKKEVFDTIGLFDENLQAGDMIEWKSKMEKNNLPIKKLNFISANRRIHNSNYGRLNKAGEYKDYASILRAKILSA